MRKIVDWDGIKHIQKQLLKSGRNSAMQVAAWIICNLLLKTQNIPEIWFFHWYSGRVSEIFKKPSGWFSYPECL